MTYQTKNIGEVDKSKNSRILFSILSGRGAHILTVIIVGHLLTEYYLDQIISTKVKKKFLKKSFSEKLNILYPSWLPLHIYKNVSLLNKARNYIAHNLGLVDYKPVIYTPTRNEKVIVSPKRKSAEKAYFKELTNCILFDLGNYLFFTLNISAEPNFDEAFKMKSGMS